MKTLFVLLSLLLVQYGALAQRARRIVTPTLAAGEGGGPTPDYTQDMEGAGTPSGWGDVGTVDWDETSIVGQGSQSLQLDSSASDSRSAYLFTDQSEVWVSAMFYPDHIPSTDAVIWRFYGADAVTALNRVRQRSTGVIRIDATGGSTADTTLSCGEDAWVYIWMRCKQGTGANAEIEFWWNTTSTFPGSANAQYHALSSNGTVTDAVDTILPYSDNVGTVNGSNYFDDIKIYFSDPGW